MGFIGHKWGKRSSTQMLNVHNYVFNVNQYLNHAKVLNYEKITYLYNAYT